MVHVVTCSLPCQRHATRDHRDGCATRHAGARGAIAPTPRTNIHIQQPPVTSTGERSIKAGWVPCSTPGDRLFVGQCQSWGELGEMGDWRAAVLLGRADSTAHPTAHCCSILPPWPPLPTGLVCKHFQAARLPSTSDMDTALQGTGTPDHQVLHIGAHGAVACASVAVGCTSGARHVRFNSTSRAVPCTKGGVTCCRVHVGCTLAAHQVHFGGGGGGACRVPVILCA